MWVVVYCIQGKSKGCICITGVRVKIVFGIVVQPTE